MSKVEIPVMKKRVGLGRGLGALLQDSDEVNNIQPRVPVLPMERPSRMEQISSMNEIALDLIETNPYQPRTHFDEEALNELADSIKVQGIIQPITVRQIGQNKFQLISGERRLQASDRDRDRQQQQPPNRDRDRERQRSQDHQSSHRGSSNSANGNNNVNSSMNSSNRGISDRSADRNDRGTDRLSYTRAIDLEMENLLRHMYADMDVKETIPLDKLAVANPDLFAQMRKAAEATVKGTGYVQNRDNNESVMVDITPKTRRQTLRSATGLGAGVYSTDATATGTDSDKAKISLDQGGPLVNAFLAEAPVVLDIGRAEALLKQLLETEIRASTLSDAETLFNGTATMFCIYFCLNLDLISSIL